MHSLLSGLWSLLTSVLSFRKAPGSGSASPSSPSASSPASSASRRSISGAKSDPTLAGILADAMVPAFALLPAKMDSPAARCQMLAIGLQESRFIHRRQIGGPARGFWQFERLGGVRGVLTHAGTKGHAQAVCKARGVPATADAVYEALDKDDVLAAAFARLLLWSDPKPLPALGDAESAWALYLRTWRPGKPHPQTWGALYGRALEATQ